MAKAFADHFGIRVQGAGAGVGFGKEGPFIRNWRILDAWRQNLMGYKSGGGGWKQILPDLIFSVMP